MPGAFTAGTEHFAHTQAPAFPAIELQYGELAARLDGLGAKLEAIDRANGGALEVSAVGEAAAVVLAMPRGQRPLRITVDGQRKGTEAIDLVYRQKQAVFLHRMGLDDMILPASPATA